MSLTILRLLLVFGALMWLYEPTARGSELPSRYAELVLIPAGVVSIGDANGPADEQPSFQYTSAAFLMDRTPVTVAQFATFVAATQYETDAERHGAAGVLNEKEGAWTAVEGANWRYPLGKHRAAAQPNHPVTQVSWYDANAFCRAYGE